MIIAIFFVVHWQASVFFQSFFLHRYGAHRQFTMSKGWERFFHLVTYLVQGSSYLSPRAYAIMHRMHHAYSDGPKDPHSPNNYPGFFAMMDATRVRYTRLKEGLETPDPRFDGGYPAWRLIDHYGASWPASIVWGALYVGFYVCFATHWWMYALVPIHWIMGPIHGAIVNWGGHRYGYRSFASEDDSKNTLVFDVLTMGELFQNNHHRYAMSPSFAARWFEVDPAYQLIKVFALLGIIDTSRSQVMRWQPSDKLAAVAAAPAVSAAPAREPTLSAAPALGGE
jgi:stearoyl-CoA desaturase (delta-9 desaturase)